MYVRMYVCMLICMYVCHLSEKACKHGATPHEEQRTDLPIPLRTLAVFINNVSERIASLIGLDSRALLSLVENRHGYRKVVNQEVAAVLLLNHQRKLLHLLLQIRTEGTPTMRVAAPQSIRMLCQNSSRLAPK